MIFDNERQELIQLFRIKHLKTLKDFTPISELIKKNDKELKLLRLALTNIRNFLSRPRYFYAILDCVESNHGSEDFNLIKCNELKIAFEIIRTICFNLIKPSNDAGFKEYKRIKVRNNNHAINIKLYKYSISLRILVDK
jgi:hypothetical protein